MKSFYLSFLFTILFLSSITAQNWQTLGSGFLSGGDIATNLQVISYQDTAFVAYADMDVVKLKKRSGNNWVTVGNYSTENNFFNLTYGANNLPYIVTLTRGVSSPGVTSIIGEIQKYENGSVSLVESRELLVIPDAQVSNLNVTNFDFTAKTDGSMACIVRFPNTASNVYHVKIGANPWFAETVFYETIGGTAGNAIEKSKISFTDEGVVILSKLFNQSLGVAHLFFHDNNSSTPTSSILNNANFSVGTGVSPIKVTSRNDTVYAAIKNNSNTTDFRSFYHDASATEPLATTLLQTYPSDFFSFQPVFTANHNYMIYTEQNASFQIEGNVVDLTSDFTLANGEILGNTTFTMGENVVGPEAMNVDPSSGEIYVAYIHGPPMTQSQLRKFGCQTASASYNSSTNILSITSTVGTGATLEWTECGETNVLGTSNTYVPSQDGDYSVTVFDGNCATTSNCVNVVIQTTPSSIQTNDNNDLSIYPNPASDIVNIAKNGNNQIVKIYDLTGKMVYQNVFSNNITVNTENFKSGIYFIKIEGNENTTTTKMVVE